MKAIALAALAVSATALATPALAGPYVESKHEFKGTDEDYSKAVHQARVGYETKIGAFKPYIEGGFGVTSPEDVIKRTLLLSNNSRKSKAVSLNLDLNTSR